MYSGTTLTKASGRILGAHQKIDRVARKHLAKLVDDDSAFPASRNILQFEGKNGPDAIKRKSPAQDEPWHYYSPFDNDDSKLLELIKAHYDKLVHELKAKHTERSAFEAAWLAHALVDGLTPAHHYPYEEKLTELLGGDSIENRTSIKEKMVLPGDTAKEKVKNNWKMWGFKGLFSTHFWFEWGVSTLLAPVPLNDAMPTEEEIKELQSIGILELFKQTARDIAALNLYDKFYLKGWTPRYAYQIRHKLGPALVRTVTLAWYSAMAEAGLIKS